ncbi:MAG: DUF1732 domain-containing protein, partial [Deltaproteobacteria bacterium]|nr:DUF1732 domain-containing protein [Deltaproteobacteria bacterium]
LAGLVAMRQAEGQRLEADLTQRLETLTAFTRTMARAAPQAAEAAWQRLKDRLEDLTDSEIDPQRLAQEAAILADKSDVTEEVVRLESHLAQFSQMLAAGGSIGRKLDFLVQEIHREINTIGSKISQAELGQQVVEGKAELEKMREQVQNLE